MNLKFSEKLYKKGKMFFLRLRFLLMRQSELTVRASIQFYLVDNDAQRTGDDFAITVLDQIFKLVPTNVV